MSKIIDEISELMSNHKIIPFLGAGASYNHLKIDWDEIANEMCQIINIPHISNIEAAEAFVRNNGQDGLCEYLKTKLLVENFTEDLDVTPLIIASLGVGLVYTTNQDNVFEKCIEKYGRKIRVVSQLSDLGAYRPGERMYIKYHGDLNIPQSVIFSQSSYQERIKNDGHFLNIRMRSDLLAKSFLFIGYSFRDPNIHQLFEEINAAFSGSLPPSYLIAYNFTDDLLNLQTRYGITIINPLAEFPDVSASEAFEKFLSAILTETCRKKAASEIEGIFRPKTPVSQRVVIRYELDAIENSVSQMALSDGISVFRAATDLSDIPPDYQPRIVEIFFSLCKKCKSKSGSDGLAAALFNLSLDITHATECLAGVLATAVFREQRGIGDLFHPIMPSLNEAIVPFAAARAIDLTKEWGWDINDQFRSHSNHWVKGYEELPESAVTYIKDALDYAWKDFTTFEHPIKYWERVNKIRPPVPGKSFQSIYASIMGNFPKEQRKPYEE